MDNLFKDNKVSQLKLGDLSINRIGLGTNRVSNKPEVKQFLSQAVEAGINFIDTAYVYSGGDSETTIGEALAPYKDGVVIATKGGMGEGGTGNNSENFLRSNLDKSLKRLKTDCITLYQIHRLDSNIPIAQTMELLKGFQTEGKIKHIGLSEISVEQLESARRHVEIVSVQNQYSLTYRKHEDVLDYCTANGIAFIPWFPLRDVNGDPELQSKLKPIADKYGINAQQLILAWLLGKSPAMLPIPGTLSLEHLKDNIASTHVALDAEVADQLSSWH
jgi:pyridoxine 4-dehydrogenase